MTASTKPESDHGPDHRSDHGLDHRVDHRSDHGLDHGPDQGKKVKTQDSKIKNFAEQITPSSNHFKVTRDSKNVHFA